MVFAYIMLAGKGVLKVPRTLIKWRSLCAASFSLMHTGSHLRPAFYYGCDSSTKIVFASNESNKSYITDRSKRNL